MVICDISYIVNIPWNSAKYRVQFSEYYGNSDRKTDVPEVNIFGVIPYCRNSVDSLMYV
jgi:hypothetical protein